MCRVVSIFETPARRCLQVLGPDVRWNSVLPTSALLLRVDSTVLKGVCDGTRLFLAVKGCQCYKAVQPNSDGLLSGSSHTPCKQALCDVSLLLVKFTNDFGPVGRGDGKGEVKLRFIWWSDFQWGSGLHFSGVMKIWALLSWNLAQYATNLEWALRLLSWE